MPSRFTIDVPADYVFARDLCSYGYFLLAPNRWRPEEFTWGRSFDAAEFGLPEECFHALIDQPAGQGAPLRVRCDAVVSAPARKAVRAAVSRMLRIDKDLTHLHRAFPATKRRGYGRLIRSASVEGPVTGTE